MPNHLSYLRHLSVDSNQEPGAFQPSSLLQDVSAMALGSHTPYQPGRTSCKSGPGNYYMNESLFCGSRWHLKVCQVPGSGSAPGLHLVYTCLASSGVSQRLKSFSPVSILSCYMLLVPPERDWISQLISLTSPVIICGVQSGSRGKIPSLGCSKWLKAEQCPVPGGRWLHFPYSHLFFWDVLVLHS